MAAGVFGDAPLDVEGVALERPGTQAGTAQEDGTMEEFCEKKKVELRKGTLQLLSTTLTIPEQG